MVTRVILSRKGFDAANGGAPSPILPDGRIVSMPIPVWHGHVIFGDVVVNGVQIGPLVEEITGGRYTGNSRCHPDPVLEGPVKGLGQVNAAEGHLKRQGVSEGDLFLFYGWFRHLRERGQGFHALFGWLVVDTVHEQPFPPYLAGHPHADPSRQ